MQIRIASVKDAAKCIKLSKESWPNWWSKNEKSGRSHIKNCIRQKNCLIAAMDDKVVGYLIWGQLWNKAHLYDIFVKPAYRKAGVGNKLVENMKEIAKNRGFKEIISDCDISNKNSIKFHLKVGFKKSGIIKGNWDGEDSVVFSKKI